MAAGDANKIVYNLKNLSVYIEDGSDPVNRLQIMFDDGTLSYTEQKNREYKMNRGVLDEDTVVRDGDDVPLEVQFQGRFGALKSTSADDISPTEILKNKHSDITFTTTDSAPCSPYAVDIVIEEARPVGCEPDYPPETVRFPMFRYESLAYDFKAGTINVSGKCKATEPIVTRTEGSS